jgi:hypothetical protein
MAGAQEVRGSSASAMSTCEGEAPSGCDGHGVEKAGDTGTPFAGLLLAPVAMSTGMAIMGSSSSSRAYLTRFGGRPEPGESSI